MKIFDRYIFKNLLFATAFVAGVLTLIIFLTQSLKFLDIVLNAGSSGSVFLLITSLALPRFFEVILPLSGMVGTLFLYQKLTSDSEVIAMRATGMSSFALAKPAILVAMLLTMVLWGITFWVAPLSLTKMKSLRQELKTEFSAFLFREGVFNPVMPGLTLYIRARDRDGALAGLIIHDTRNPQELPTTIIARRGVLVSSDSGYQVVVFDGKQQQYNPETRVLQKLKFDRYTIDLPSAENAGVRWLQPDERTITQLLSPDLTNVRDKDSMDEFRVEIHRRVTAPLLALSFCLIALVAILPGPFNRRGQTSRIIGAVVVVMIVQGLFLTVYNIAKNNEIGVFLMYALTCLPTISCVFFLSRWSEVLRRQMLFRRRYVLPQGDDAI